MEGVYICVYDNYVMPNVSPCADCIHTVCNTHPIISCVHSFLFFFLDLMTTGPTLSPVSLLWVP